MLCFFGSYEVSLEVSAEILLPELGLSLRRPLQSCGYLNSQTADPVPALLRRRVLCTDFQIVALFWKYGRCLWPKQFDGSCSLEV